MCSEYEDDYEEYELPENWEEIEREAMFPNGPTDDEDEW
jgi:hypothetical protein